MIRLTPQQIAEYFHRSYTAVDGLWFSKVEEKYGFEAALGIDNEVWKVFPKMQARLLKSMAEMGSGLEALYECLTTKLAIEGFKFQDKKSGNGVTIIISECPWHNLMIKSGREKLSGKVGTMVCNTEYSVWASEFGENLGFELKDQICQGAPYCVLQFKSA